MQKIKILSEAVSNAIAAGEVVEHPASLVKELLENSLDADSKKIYLSIRNGGREVEIKDDGLGMSREDMLLCIERHATSKIFQKEDLFALKSYGFRGEALSSIAAVSKLRMLSCERGEKLGNKMTVLGGKVTGIQEVACSSGTEIQIQDLFFNTPARLKFLRKSSTEYMQIKDIVLREALANPEVQIRLEIDGRESIYSSGNGIENSIVEIFGKNALKNLRKMSLGYIGNENLYRSNKDSMFIFVNGRPVKSKLVEDAVLDAYYTKLMKGKYPFVCLFLEVDPAEIDVNVHPSKKVVKFADNAKIYQEVKEAISAVFTEEKDFSFAQFVAREESVKSLESEEETKEEEVREERIYEDALLQKASEKEHAIFEETGTSWNQAGEDSHFPVEKHEKIPLFDLKKTETSAITDRSSWKTEVREEKKSYDFKILAQVYDSFLLVERKGILEIYDQHIIHERILYEDFKKQYYGNAIPKQQLLVPLRISLDPREKEVFLEHLEHFSYFGMEAEDFGGRDVLIRTLPAVSFQESTEEIVRDILHHLMTEKDMDIREKMIISMSCKGAIKANEKLVLEDMYPMIARLHEIGEYTCPHGRPIILQVTLEELEKWFKRK